MCSAGMPRPPPSPMNFTTTGVCPSASAGRRYLALMPSPPGPGELRVVHLDRRVDVGFVPSQHGRARRGAGLRQALLPPLVKFRRLRGIRAIFTQLVQWQVKPGH